ncbi:hypothetical protein Z052_02385 [Halorubrum sp. C191]|nr:hypothetical protein DJ84_04065 [Halorubrum ezzemoulense]PHQ43754.1 hypothetical protein Z052_02385 [Halorubrum sp. C191]
MIIWAPSSYVDIIKIHIVPMHSPRSSDQCIVYIHRTILAFYKNDKGGFPDVFQEPLFIIGISIFTIFYFLFIQRPE